MRKLLFAHDSYFGYRNGIVHSMASFPSYVWYRYLKHFDSILVLARSTDNTNLQNVKGTVSKVNGVNFKLINGSFRSACFLPCHKYNKMMYKKVHETDAVIARLPSEAGMLAVYFAKKLGKPYAVELTGCPWDGLWNYGNWKGKMYAPIMTTRIKYAVANAPFVLYVTKNFLQNRYPNYYGKTTACSNVELPEPKSDVLDKRFKKIEQQGNQIVLGLIGTLRTRYKGIQTVLKSLGKIRYKLPPIKFRLLGGGYIYPWKKEAEKHGVSDMVIFEGTLPAGEQVFNWLDNVDIYLQPSFKEGLPRALIEAMSRGCPSLASNCAGISELLEEDSLIKPGDDEHLAKLILKMTKDKEWQKKQAQRNWEIAHEYAKDRLDARRNNFWAQFAEFAEKYSRDT